VETAPGSAGDCGVVRHQQHGFPLLHQSVEKIQHLLGRGGIQVAGRLVGQDQVGAQGQGTGDGNSLLFTAGQFARVTSFLACQANRGQQCRGLAFRRRLAGAGIQERQCNVLLRAQESQQVEVLKDKADATIP
jgi:hypothetical protein